MNEKIQESIYKVTQCLKEFDKIKLDLSEYEGLPREDAERKGVYLRDFGMGQWDWPQGVAIMGLNRISKDNQEYILNWAQTEILKGLPTKNINTITPMLTLVDYPEYDKLSLEWMEWVNDSFPRTKENGFQHITSGPDKFTVEEHTGQVWIDTLFMTVLFVAKMGIKHNKQEWIDEAVYQFLLHSKYLLDRETGLFYHGWNFIENHNYGGNFWCRGNSWFTLSVPILLEITGDRIPSSIKKYIVQLYKNQVETLLRMRANNGLWHTILNDKDSYLETSGSAGILAGIYMGLNQEILEKEIVNQANESLETLMGNYINPEGIVLGVSAGTAISRIKDDYKGIIQMPMVYGQATILLALEEAKRFLEE